MPHGQKAKPKQNKKKQKQHCDKFNKDFFLMVHIRGKKKKTLQKKDYKDENMRHVATWRKSVAGR